MKFTVVWDPTAEGRLAELWLTAPNRQAIAEASDQIDHELRVHADTAGESRSGGVRILVVSPLSISFEVSLEDRLATVFAIWQYPSVDTDD